MTHQAGRSHRAADVRVSRVGVSGARSLSSVRGVSVLIVLAVLTVRRPVAGQSVNNVDPTVGSAGTTVTVSGNQVGCYCCGPGAESSTWGTPESAQLWIDKTDSQSYPLAGNEGKFQMIGSISGGGASCGSCNPQSRIPGAWQVQGSVPSLPPGSCYQIYIRFTPQCGWLPSGDQTPGDAYAGCFTVTGGGGPTPTPPNAPTPTPSPGSGDCCSVRFDPACNDASCQSCVCGLDNFCCTDSWDDLCVESVYTDCAGSCQCSGGGLPTPTPTPDCSIGAMRNGAAADTSCPVPACAISLDSASSPRFGRTTVTITVTLGGAQADSVLVHFAITAGPNSNPPATNFTFTTDGNGQVVTDYTDGSDARYGSGSGIDTLEASGSVNGQRFTCNAAKTWQGPWCTIDPPSATKEVGTPHTVTVTATQAESGAPVAFVRVDLESFNPSLNHIFLSSTSDGNGKTSFSYVDTGGKGIDRFFARGQAVDSFYFDCEGTVTWKGDPSCNIDPPRATSPVGGSHTVTVTVTDSIGQPAASVPVHFAITAGPNSVPSEAGDYTTDGSGNVLITYSEFLGGVFGAGTDSLQVTGSLEGKTFRCYSTKKWGPPEAGLTRSIGALDAVIPVNDVSQFAYKGEIQIDDERMTYDGTRALAATLLTHRDAADATASPVAGELLNVQRGVEGTVPAAHQAAANVFLIPPGAPGDCNGDGVVTVDELLTGVNIALGNVALDQCPSFDTNADGAVTVDELLSAVNAALNGPG